MKNSLNMFELNANFFSKNFLNEELFVQIIFLKNFPKLNLITFSFGPFKKGSKVIVKIWVAFILKKINWCNIKMPYWLKDEVIEKKILSEKKKKYNRATTLLLF